MANTNRDNGGDSDTPALDEEMLKFFRTAPQEEIQGTLAMHAYIMQLQGARHYADMPSPFDNDGAEFASAKEEPSASADNPPASPVSGEKTDAPVSKEKTDAPVSGETTDAPVSGEIVDAPVSGEAADAHNIGQENVNQDTGGNETTNALPPRTWEARHSQCQESMHDMVRTLE